MSEVPPAGDNSRRNDIEDAVAALNRQEQQKSPGQRREFTALGVGVPSSIFRTFDGQGGMVNWYVIAGDARGLWYLAAPIRLKGGIGLEMQRRRVFSRSEMEREAIIDAMPSLSEALIEGLNRLAASHGPAQNQAVELSPASGLSDSLAEPSAIAQRSIDDLQQRFALRFCGILLDCNARGPRIEVWIHQPEEAIRVLMREMRNGGIITIGRLIDSDIYLDQISVSRQHAEMKYENGRWFARDGQSYNGTKIADQRLTEEWLVIPTE
jgi:hypothetical protein